jgi:hypothetical protein
MLHAALLLLMLEAANARPRFTISLKRSTQNLQLSTSSLADYPIFDAANGQAILLNKSGSSDLDRGLELVSAQSNPVSSKNFGYRKFAIGD